MKERERQAADILKDAEHMKYIGSWKTESQAGQKGGVAEGEATDTREVTKG